MRSPGGDSLAPRRPPLTWTIRERVRVEQRRPSDRCKKFPNSMREGNRAHARYASASHCLRPGRPARSPAPADHVVCSRGPMRLFSFVMLVFRPGRRATACAGLRSWRPHRAIDRELESAQVAGARRSLTSMGDLPALPARAAVVPTQPRWRPGSSRTRTARQSSSLRSSRPHRHRGSRLRQGALATRKPFSELIVDLRLRRRVISRRPVSVMGSPLFARRSLNERVSSFWRPPRCPPLKRRSSQERHCAGRRPRPERGSADTSPVALLLSAPALTRARRGAHSYFAHGQTALAGWTVAVSVPSEIVDAPLRRSLAVAVGGGLVVLIVGAVLALRLARRVARPIEGLVEAAEGLGRGQTVTPASSQIEELTRLGAAIATAGLERERVEQALRATVKRSCARSHVDAGRHRRRRHRRRYVDCNPAARSCSAFRATRCSDAASATSRGGGGGRCCVAGLLLKGKRHGDVPLAAPDGGERTWNLCDGGLIPGCTSRPART